MLITTTVLPILCLMEWNSPKCQEHSFNLPAPKFAPNFRLPKFSPKVSKPIKQNVEEENVQGLIKQEILGYSPSGPNYHKKICVHRLWLKIIS